MRKAKKQIHVDKETGKITEFGWGDFGPTMKVIKEGKRIANPQGNLFTYKVKKLKGGN